MAVSARAERRATQMRGLTEVSRALTYAVSFEEVLQIVVRKAAELLDASATVLMLADDNGLMTIRASVGLATVALVRPYTLDDSVTERLQQLLGVSPERFLGVPLVVGGAVTGILAVALAEERSSTAEEQEWLLSALADQAAVSLERSRLDERGQFRDRLIGIVSHDLRNPLNTVLLGTSALLDNPKLDAYAIKTLTRIHSAAERAARMISDLLDYTQAHLGGGIHVQRLPNDLGSIARQVVNEIEIAHPANEFEYTASGDARATFDGDRLAQVLGNLLSNAAHYSPKGSAIRVEVRGEATHVVVTVHNSGDPIPPDRLRDIFEPMQQLNPHGGHGHRSVGLGLYIVDSIVNAHKGTVLVASSADEGTTFTVSIPRDVVWTSTPL